MLVVIPNFCLSCSSSSRPLAVSSLDFATSLCVEDSPEEVPADDDDDEEELDFWRCGLW